MIIIQNTSTYILIDYNTDNYMIFYIYLPTFGLFLSFNTFPPLANHKYKVYNYLI